jgi:flagellar assembly protein FliH
MFRIIKAKDPATKTTAPSDQDSSFVDISHEVQSRLEDAQAAAAHLLDQAREASERLRADAEQQGLQRARQTVDQQLRAELDTRLDSALPALKDAIESVHREKAKHLRRCEQHVVQLAIAIAQRLVRRELKQKPEIALDLVREALDLAAGHERIKLHLNPTDHETLGDRMVLLARDVRDATHTDIIADPQVSPGGCIVTTEYGVIDQRVETQLARIEEELT